MKVPNIFVPEKNLEKSLERMLNKEVHEKTRLMYTKFEVIRADTYADGIAELKKHDKKLFTFSEVIEARIADYKINGKDAELFKSWLDSITGVMYKANSTKFKLILKSNRFENIDLGFNQNVIPIDYDTEYGIELDITEDKYDQPLTRKEAKEHEFWLAAMNSDKERLVEYVNIWFDKTKSKKGMGVHLRGNRRYDELWALVLGNDGNFSDVFGVTDIEVAQFVSGVK